MACQPQAALTLPTTAVSALRSKGAAVLLLCCLCMGPGWASAQTIGNHPGVYDSRGFLQPWTSWQDALNREVNWYLKCPWTNGYPRFVVMTFMDGNYNPRRDRPDSIPAMQNGMGIISYLKYYAWSGRSNPKLLEIARSMGGFLVKENLTPDEGKYPRFPRSTGHRYCFPQPPDCGSQADHPYEIEPDKGGIAGYALALLYEETKDERYLCEKKEKLDEDWQKDAHKLIDFVNKRFTSIKSGVLVCGEQDDDINPWGGAVSTYGGVLAVYSKATGSDEFKGLAWQVLNYALYSIDDDGCPSEAVWKGRRRGGWQEDAHTDKLHNFVDAMNAFPEWAK
jgi:hypothetical protein